MKITRSIIFILLLASYLASAQEKVILDTDPGYDPDDMGCMAMLHTMATFGECEILAVVSSTDYKESPLTISAINKFYNRGAIPVGDYKGYPSKKDAPDDTYHYHVARNFPRDMKSWEESLDAVALYREILASAENESITIVVIGTQHNFYGLLKSGPCKYSDKTGIELVKEKVKLVGTMGGNFIDGKGLDRTNWGGANALCDYTFWSCLNEERNRMCRFVIDNCPAPFMASGWEVGCGDYHNANYGNVMTGQGLKKLDENHIIRKCYEYHFKYRGGEENISRHSNDQCALHYTIRGESENYTALTNGRITLTEAGVCSWKETDNGYQGYIQKKRDKVLIAQEIEALMMGEVMELDKTPPNKPKGLEVTNGRLLTWKASEDETKGSWVVGYRIYQSNKLVATVHGTKYFVGESSAQSSVYEVRAINAAGMESKGSKINISK